MLPELPPYGSLPEVLTCAVVLLGSSASRPAFRNNASLQALTIIKTPSRRLRRLCRW